MKRIAALAIAASFCFGSLIALNRSASASPPEDVPQARDYQALETLSADGLLSGYPDQAFWGDRPLTRQQMAKLVARAIAKVQANGTGTASTTDMEALHELFDSLKDELLLLGVRVTSFEEALKPVEQRTTPARSIQVLGTVLANSSTRQLGGVPHTIQGASVEPFVNAFQTTTANNNPFEHDAQSGGFLRGEGKFTFTHALDQNVSVSLPVRITSFKFGYGGPGRPWTKYAVSPSLVINMAKLGQLHDVYFRGGELDNLESSRLGLAYRAPDATMQGPGFQNSIQPYDKGIQVGGVLKYTHFQFTLSKLDQAMLNTFPGFDNFLLIDTPPATSYIQPGVAVSPVGAPRTDTFVASAGSINAVYLSAKAGIGSVYISSINGTPCNAAALTPGGTPCPLRAWYYIDQTNQVVFQTPLPAGSIVQVSYSGLSFSNVQLQRQRYQFTRYHFNARVNQEFKGLPGAEVGLSLSRIIDADAPGLGDGYGAVSDTVWGLDARLPVWFIRLGKDRMEHPVLYGEAALSKYTGDAFNSPGITDSALALGLRLKLGSTKTSLQYQAVGPNFMDGAPARFMGPPPLTFSFWTGNYFPQFFGFSNSLALNKTFDSTISPGCTGTACTQNNARLTYIYPVFNPFVATGPQYYSDFAPNNRGLTEKFSAQLGGHDNPVEAHLSAQQLQEMQPNGFGQIAYGPGFGTNTRLKFTKFEGGVQFGIPMFHTKGTVHLSDSSEHLFRKDMTAYSYIPFNTATGGPDPSATANLNTYLSIPGNTPILFFPNFVDVYHMTFEGGVNLPLAHDFDFGLLYNSQSFRGSYATILGQNMDQRKNNFDATLTYLIPKTNSSIGFLFRNLSYTDNTLSTYNFSQNREDLTFTIRF